MNPINIFKLPPAVMLLIIIGLAVLVTMMVTGRVASEQRLADTPTTSSQTTNSPTTSSPATSSRQDNGPHKSVVYSLSYIPAGSKIESKQLQLKDIPELEAWDDAQTSVTETAGGTAKHAIPAYTQIRKIDLE